jgi:hypothetical protein
MGLVIVDVSPSLDGYVGGPSARRTEVEQAGVVTTPYATHLTYQLAPSR